MRSLLSVLLLSAVALHSTGASSPSACSLSDADLDVIFVVDVSQAMDSRSLAQASSHIESISNSLRFEPAFFGRNSSDFNSTLFLTELPWAGFAWNNNSDYNATFTREMYEILGSNLAISWNNTDNSTSNREFSEMLFSNLGWNNTDNSTFTREMMTQVMFANLAFAWNNNTGNSTSNREFSEMLFSNLALAWNNTNNSTNTREFSEILLSNLALGWNNTDSNSTSFMSELPWPGFAWNNNSSDSNSTSNREFSEMLFANLAFWNNNTNNSSFTREMLSEMLFTNLYGNFSGNYSRVGLVAVGDTAEIISELSSPFSKSNLSPSTASHARIEYGISSALDMFAAASTRSSRQMIYIISASHSQKAFNPRFGKTRFHSPTAAFKRAGGIIAVTDLTSAGGGSPSLHHLASDGFYNRGFRDDVSVELQTLCKANRS